MALFPDIYPTVWDPEWDRYEEHDQSKHGRLQVNQWDPTNHFSGKAQWSMLTRTQYDLIEDHWFAYTGLPFTLFNFRARKLRGVYIAVADGVATVYDLPGKEIVTPTIKHNGVAAGTQPTRLVGTGLEGRDQIQYTAPTKPGAGVVLTIDALDGRQAFDVLYGNVKFIDRHREADIWAAEAQFLRSLVA